MKTGIDNSCAYEYQYKNIRIHLSDLWRPNRPDLNQVGYKIRGCLYDRVYQKHA